MTHRLLFFTENYFGGGSDKTICQYIECARNSGHEVSFAANKKAIVSVSGQLAETIDINYKPVGLLNKDFLYNALRSRSRLARRAVMFFFSGLLDCIGIPINIIVLSKLLYESRPTYVCIFNGGYPGALSCRLLVIICKTLNIRAALSIVSSPKIKTTYFSLLELAFDKVVNFCSHRVIVNASSIAEELARLRGFSKEKLKLIRNGIKVKKNNQIQSCKDCRGNIVIGVACRLDKLKGCEFLLDAFMSLCHKHNNILLFIAGSGPTQMTLEKKARDSEFSSRISFGGRYESHKVYTILDKIDIYAFPSLHEGFPYSILEAMNAGCSIVSTDVGGINEAIINGVNGILVKPGCAKSLADGVDYMLSNPEIRKVMTIRSKEDVISKFSEEVMWSEIKRFFAID